jgi:hypothetical protein
MESKRRIVRFAFTAEFESTTDMQAFAFALSRLESGGLQPRQLELRVVAELPLVLPSPVVQPPTPVDRGGQA